MLTLPIKPDHYLLLGTEYKRWGEYDKNKQKREYLTT